MSAPLQNDSGIFSMQIKVKICGLSTVEAVNAAVKGGASHVGFMISRRSMSGFISLEQAAALALRVPSHVRRVGVFFEQDSIFFDQAIACAGLHVLQLHATDPRQALNERYRTGRSIWGVVTIRSGRDLLAATHWKGSANRILYEIKEPEITGKPAKSESKSGWKLIEGMAHPLPWTLGGSLDLDNVAEAIASTGAQMIDVSTGIESAPGIQDPSKIAAILNVLGNIKPARRRM